MSSINLFQNQGFISCVFKNSVSVWSIKIQAYEGAKFVPIAIPDIYLQNLKANSNKLFLRTKSAIFPISYVENFLLVYFPYFFLSMSKPALCGMLG